MQKILIINGPNLNRLGKRDKSHYGTITLNELEILIKNKAKQLNIDLVFFQSNHEGAIIDFIQMNCDSATGMLINPGALTHYSYALHDAILDSGLKTIEVHLSDLSKREDWRQKSVTKDACMAVFQGKGQDSYLEALHFLYDNLNKKND